MLVRRASCCRVVESIYTKVGLTSALRTGSKDQRHGTEKMSNRFYGIKSYSSVILGSRVWWGCTEMPTFHSLGWLGEGVALPYEKLILN
jgi:hypothetical protein